MKKYIFLLSIFFPLLGLAIEAGEGPCQSGVMLECFAGPKDGVMEFAATKGQNSGGSQHFATALVNGMNYASGFLEGIVGESYPAKKETCSAELGGTYYPGGIRKPTCSFVNVKCSSISPSVFQGYVNCEARNREGELQGYTVLNRSLDENGRPVAKMIEMEDRQPLEVTRAQPIQPRNGEAPGLVFVESRQGSFLAKDDRSFRAFGSEIGCEDLGPGPKSGTFECSNFKGASIPASAFLNKEKLKISVDDLVDSTEVDFCLIADWKNQLASKSKLQKLFSSNEKFDLGHEKTRSVQIQPPGDKSNVPSCQAASLFPKENCARILVGKEGVKCWRNFQIVAERKDLAPSHEERVKLFKKYIATEKTEFLTFDEVLKLSMKRAGSSVIRITNLPALVHDLESKNTGNGNPQSTGGTR